MSDLLLLLLDADSPYLMEDQLAASSAAPITTPRAAEPGPGRLHKVLDTVPIVSIANGSLWYKGTPAVANVDPAFYWDSGSGPFSRSAGRTVFFKVITPTSTAGAFVVDWTNNVVVALTTQWGGEFASGNVLNNMRAGFRFAVGAWSNVATYIIAVTLRATGNYLHIIGGAFSEWTRIWVEPAWADANVYPAATGTGALDFRVSDVQVKQAWPSDSLATVDVSNPVSGVDQTAQADGWFHAHFTLGAGSAGKQLEFRYRVVDGMNYMLARIQWNVVNSQWDFVTGHVITGVETLQGAAIANVGVNTIIAVRADGNSHDFYTFTTFWTKRYATITDANFNTAMLINVTWNISTASALRSWKVRGDMSALGAYTIKNIWPYGDSKTGSDYEVDLLEQMAISNAYLWRETPTRVAVGGRNTQNAKDNIDAELTAASGTPDYVLYNLGANDVLGSPVQATWVSNTRYIWDAIHVKWPSAKIYVMRVWVRDEDADCDALNDTWIPEAMTGRTDFVFLGGDERIFLKGSDNGVTYTSDGVHPNTAGMIETAKAWKVAMGF